MEFVADIPDEIRPTQPCVKDALQEGANDKEIAISAHRCTRVHDRKYAGREGKDPRKTRHTTNPEPGQERRRRNKIFGDIRTGIQGDGYDRPNTRPRAEQKRSAIDRFAPPEDTTGIKRRQHGQCGGTGDQGGLDRIVLREKVQARRRIVLEA